MPLLTSMLLILYVTTAVIVVVTVTDAHTVTLPKEECSFTAVFNCAAQAGQDFDPSERSVLNKGELLGSQVVVTAQGSYEPQVSHCLQSFIHITHSKVTMPRSQCKQNSCAVGFAHSLSKQDAPVHNAAHNQFNATCFCDTSHSNMHMSQAQLVRALANFDCRIAIQTCQNW